MNAARSRWTAFGRTALLSTGLLACGGNDSADAAAPAQVQFIKAFPALEFEQPLYFTHAPGSPRVFVVTQAGVIHVFNNNPDVGSAKVFLDLRERVTDDGGELGLLGLAFDPDYASNGFFYVNYNPDHDGSVANPRRTAVSRFKVTANPDVADPASESLLLSFTQPFSNHNGGWLGFGPDGKLYIASGDGGSGGDPGNVAQNLGNLLGKILRINTDGSIPGDNPFAGQADKRGEIWAYGLRNPWRASFDRTTGELWTGDVGQNAWEEIDLITRGGNYGWRKFEGNHVFKPDDPDPGNTIRPVFEYDHAGRRCSITGGYVYRGTAISGLKGSYLYADFCSSELWALTRNANGSYSNALLGRVPGNPSSFGEDAAGETYITSFDGNIYKLVAR